MRQQSCEEDCFLDFLGFCCSDWKHKGSLTHHTDKNEKGKKIQLTIWTLNIYELIIEVLYFKYVFILMMQNENVQIGIILVYLTVASQWCAG